MSAPMGGGAGREGCVFTPGVPTRGSADLGSPPDPLVNPGGANSGHSRPVCPGICPYSGIVSYTSFAVFASVVPKIWVPMSTSGCSVRGILRRTEGQRAKRCRAKRSELADLVSCSGPSGRTRKMFLMFLRLRRLPEAKKKLVLKNPSLWPPPG